MPDAQVAIADAIALDADLTDRAGLPLGLTDGRIRPGADVVVEEDLVRRLSDMREVVADDIGRRGAPRRLPHAQRRPPRAGHRARGPAAPLRAHRPRWPTHRLGGRQDPWARARATGGRAHRLSRGRRGPSWRGRIPHPGPGRRPGRTAQPASLAGPRATGRLGRPAAGPGARDHRPRRRSARLQRRHRPAAPAASTRASPRPTGSAGTWLPTGACGPTRATPTRHASRRSPPSSGPGRQPSRCTAYFRDDPTRLGWLSEPARFGVVAPALADRIADALA